MFTVTGQVVKTFIQTGGVDKETGEIAPDTAKVQILGEMPVRGGDSRVDLVTLTIDKVEDYKPLQGKRIRVPLGFFAPSKGTIVYFIAKGGKPEVLN
jgi:hypothetical protein